jgi:hypothetical protein
MLLLLLFFNEYRTITVFRESNFKQHTVSPSEWKGDEEHEEDILCAAVMKNLPMV